MSDRISVRAGLDFSGRVVCVTGGSSGIGAALVTRFAEAGADVAFSYLRDRNGANRTIQHASSSGRTVASIQADVSRSEDSEKLIQTVLQQFGRLDVLINNAGIYPVSPLLELREDEWKSVIATNLSGVHYSTQYASVCMDDQREGGAIVNISSIEAFLSAPGHAHYAAAKAGVEAYTRNAAYELANSGIRVNAVAPGLIERPGLEQMWPEGVERWRTRAPLKRLGQPGDVADAALFLSSPLAGWITGTTLVVDGGLQAAPGF